MCVTHPNIVSERERDDRVMNFSDIGRWWGDKGQYLISVEKGSVRFVSRFSSFLFQYGRDEPFVLDVRSTERKTAGGARYRCGRSSVLRARQWSTSCHPGRLQCVSSTVVYSHFFGYAGRSWVPPLGIQSIGIHEVLFSSGLKKLGLFNQRIVEIGRKEYRDQPFGG